MKINLYKFYPTIIIMLLIFAGSTISGKRVEEVEIFHFRNFDKLVHILMYFTLSLTLSRDLYRSMNNLSLNRMMVITFLMIAAYGGSLEIIQKYFTVDRTADILDFTADSIGFILALPIILLFHRRYESLKK